METNKKYDGITQLVYHKVQPNSKFLFINIFNTDMNK